MTRRLSTSTHRSIFDRAGLTAEQLAGLCFVVLSGMFLTNIMLCAAIAPGYVMQDSAISDLGTIPETRDLFNSTLVLVSLINIAGGAALFGPRRQWGRLSIATLAGIGAMGAGLVTLDRAGVHGLFALAAFVAFNLQVFATIPSNHGAIRLLGWMLGAIGLAFVVIMAIGDAGNPDVFGPIGHGGAERMIVYPPMLWLMVLGGYLIRRQ